MRVFLLLLVFVSSALAQAPRPPTPQDRTITFIVLNRNGDALTNGVKHQGKIPFTGVLKGWVMTCFPDGSITADVLRSANGAGLPSSSIVGSGTKPSISSSTENSSTSFTSWTSTTLTAGDKLAVDLSGITAVSYVQLTLYFR